MVFEYEGVGLGFGIELSRGGRLGFPPIVRLVRDKKPLPAYLTCHQRFCYALIVG